MCLTTVKAVSVSQTSRGCLCGSISGFCLWSLSSVCIRAVLVTAAGWWTSILEPVSFPLWSSFSELSCSGSWALAVRELFSASFVWKRALRFTQFQSHPRHQPRPQPPHLTPTSVVFLGSHSSGLSVPHSPCPVVLAAFTRCLEQCCGVITCSHTQ